MNRFLYRLQRFMAGRNGVDQASIALLIASLCLSFIAQILGWWWLALLSYVGLGVCLFRILSKNSYKRQRENQWVCEKMRAVTRWWKRTRQRFTERNTFRYLQCPACKQWLKVPRGKGKIEIHCNKCGNHFVETV